MNKAPSFPYGFVVKTKEEAIKACGGENGKPLAYDKYVESMEDLAGKVCLTPKKCEEYKTSSYGTRYGFGWNCWAWDYRWVTPLAKMEAKDILNSKETYKVVGIRVPDNIDRRVQIRSISKDFTYQFGDSVVMPDVAKGLKGSVIPINKFISTQIPTNELAIYFLGAWWPAEELEVLVESVTKVEPTEKIIRGDEFALNRGKYDPINYTIKSTKTTRNAFDEETLKEERTNFSLFDKITYGLDKKPVVIFWKHVIPAYLFKVLVKA